ncbi:hypothetical protein R4369_29370 [Rhodococcus opacus]|nr:hypothetical protein [Rhodococcus opacus]MDV7088282.1 hypothetical protein [Rhodococcus opacus]
MLSEDGFGAQIGAAADRGDITYEQAPLIVRSLLSAGVDTTGNGLASVLRLRRITDRAQAGCGLEVTQQSVSIWDSVVLVPSSHMGRARLRVRSWGSGFRRWG